MLVHGTDRYAEMAHEEMLAKVGARELAPERSHEPIPVQQSELWGRQDDFKVLGAILADCERDMRQIAEGTFRNRAGGDRMTFGDEAVAAADFLKSALAAMRAAAFTKADDFDRKAKELRSKA